MNFHIDVHIHVHNTDTGLLTKILNKVTQMSIELDTLIAKVAELETVEASAIELLSTLHAKLDEAIAANDLPAIQALSDRLEADKQLLAEAITANTAE